MLTQITTNFVYPCILIPSKSTIWTIYSVKAQRKISRVPHRLWLVYVNFLRLLDVPKNLFLSSIMETVAGNEHHSINQRNRNRVSGRCASAGENRQMLSTIKSQVSGIGSLIL